MSEFTLLVKGITTQGIGKGAREDRRTASNRCPEIESAVRQLGKTADEVCKVVGVGRRSFFAYLAQQREQTSTILTAN